MTVEMKPLSNDLIDALLADYKKPEDLIGQNGLLKQLTKALVERALQAEMTDHLGHGKNQLVANEAGNPCRAAAAIGCVSVWAEMLGLMLSPARRLNRASPPATGGLHLVRVHDQTLLPTSPFRLPASSRILRFAEASARLQRTRLPSIRPTPLC
jgi:hypothetical protein